jgi:hypothetical protein
MFLDSLEISAIIGFFSVVVGITGYAVQNHYVKKGEKETREYRLKRRQYERFVKMMAEGFHIVRVKKQPTSLDYKKTFDEVTNTLYLYASGDVIRALKKYRAKGELEEFRNLIFAMRNDINIKPDLTASEIDWFVTT